MKIEENSGGISSSPNGESPSSSVSTSKKDPSKFAELGKKVGLLLLFLLIGALAVTVALYLPTRSQLNTSQTEVERLTEIETQYNALLLEFNLAKAQSAVYKTISDASLLRTALLENDTTKAGQQIRYVEDDLAALNIPEYPEILQRLQSQFNKLKSAGTSQESLVELDEFYKDLLLLADNLR